MAKAGFKPFGIVLQGRDFEHFADAMGPDRLSILDVVITSIDPQTEAAWEADRED